MNGLDYRPLPCKRRFGLIGQALGQVVGPRSAPAGAVDLAQRGVPMNCAVRLPQFGRVQGAGFGLEPPARYLALQGGEFGLGLGLFGGGAVSCRCPSLILITVAGGLRPQCRFRSGQAGQVMTGGRSPAPVRQRDCLAVTAVQLGRAHAGRGRRAMVRGDQRPAARQVRGWIAAPAAPGAARPVAPPSARSAHRTRRARVRCGQPGQQRELAGADRRVVPPAVISAC